VQNLLWDSAYVLLHRKLKGEAMKGVLTGEAFWAVGKDGGEVVNRCLGRWKLFGSILHLYEKAGDMRQWSRPLANDEKHEGERSPAMGGRWFRDPSGRPEE
jgi:hypothetical protein